MAKEHRDHHREGKPGLRTWWQHIITTQKPRTPASPHAHTRSLPQPQSQPQEYVRPPPGAVFGRPLKESVRYASVQISTADPSGRLYVWGYIPVVVAKCGLFLKENATEVEGTFRVNGSNKRMRDLQAIFETPPRYGKALNWKQENYTSHDVASVFRRYLTQMPVRGLTRARAHTFFPHLAVADVHMLVVIQEPVIPYEFYFPFRDAIANKPYNQEVVIATYKRLIHSMPPANQYLLLYVLDLLSVFARKSDKNLMTAQNLAVIFRPGLISHPTHELSPTEHRLSQDVLEFLIAHQDWFMLDTQSPPVLPAPPSRSLTPPITAHSAGASMTVSDDDGPDGWRIVDRHPRPPAQTTERPQIQQQAEARRSLGARGIMRSRTVPARKSRSNTVDAGALQRGPGVASGSAPSPGVLRKARRASAQPVG
ncbi:Rho GTPase activation protein [Russula earlei]|uniref:Rho GTPase activation protein n=1 Tax=Russula earlei TaxID=71964 RepID=A0ACC0TY17_9AGAM|nr:Rho GTPase activation protein [Russula earlei]